MINTEAIEDVTHDPEEWHKFWTDELTSSLLDASLCVTREEAQKIMQKADNSSQKVSGTCYGFEYNHEEHMESFKVTHL